MLTSNLEIYRTVASRVQGLKACSTTIPLEYSCYCQTVLDNDDSVIPTISPQLGYYHPWAPDKENETQGMSHQKAVVHLDSDMPVAVP